MSTTEATTARRTARPTPSAPPVVRRPWEQPTTPTRIPKSIQMIPAPMQSENVAAKNPQKVKELKQMFIAEAKKWIEATMTSQREDGWFGPRESLTDQGIAWAKSLGIAADGGQRVGVGAARLREAGVVGDRRGPGRLTDGDGLQTGVALERTGVLHDIGDVIRAWDQLDGVAEYTRIEPYVYSNRIAGNAYTQNGIGLGHHLPPNSDEWFAQLSYRPFRSLRTWCTLTRVRHGEKSEREGQRNERK